MNVEEVTTVLQWALGEMDAACQLPQPYKILGLIYKQA